MEWLPLDAGTNEFTREQKPPPVGSAQAKLHQAVVDELVEIRRTANEACPLDTPMTRAYGQREALLAIDARAEKAVALLEGRDAG